MTAQNKIMVTRLERNNVIRSSSVKKAFLAIDRGFFVNDDISEAGEASCTPRLGSVPHLGWRATISRPRVSLCTGQVTGSVGKHVPRW